MQRRKKYFFTLTEPANNLLIVFVSIEEKMQRSISEIPETLCNLRSWAANL